MERLEKPSGTPYVGPYPILEGQPFYGRDQEISYLADILIDQRIVLLHSSSGAGKTSLIDAGLIPILRETFDVLPFIQINRSLPVYLPPSETPPNRYMLSALRSLNEDKNLPAGERLSLEELSKLNLEQYLRTRRAKQGESKPLLLIFDQFEEILTIDPTDQEQKETFFSQLSRIMKEFDKWIIFVMRDDYVGNLEPYLRYFPNRLSARFRLDLLSREAALNAVRKPAKLFGVEYQEGVAERLVDDLRQVVVQEGDQKTTIMGKYVEPILLQVACSSLWDARRLDAAQITLEDYQHWGPVDNALGDYFTKKVAAVSSLTGLRERNLRNWVEYQLITERGVRNRVHAGRESEYLLNPQAVEALIKTYLVRKYEDSQETRYMLAHDRLIEPVRRANAQWRLEKLQPFQRKADQWEHAKRPVEQLLGVAELAEADGWANDNPAELSDIDKMYLDASRAALPKPAGIVRDAEQALRIERGVNLEQTGWGVIYPADSLAREAIKQALEELLSLRRSQAGQIDPARFHEYTYSPGLSPEEFLESQGGGRGLADPARLPYYLLIAGGPQEVPFEFQYGLAAKCAVGRVAFDSLEEYASYARTVARSESEPWRLPKRAVLVTPVQETNRAANQVLEQLTIPLFNQLSTAASDWQVEKVVGAQADKAHLQDHIGGASTPALLFYTGHSVPPMARQEWPEETTGGLVCADYQGQELLREHVFYSGDVPDQASLAGLVVFQLSGWTAGVPQTDELPFLRRSEKLFDGPARLARLPQRLLGHPRGGALAVIGHVEELWMASFVENPTDQDEVEETDQAQKAAMQRYTLLATMGAILQRLMQGYTVGSAMEALSQRYARLAAQLNERLQEIYFLGKQEGASGLKQLMVRMIDARNFVLLGDPAARLVVDAAPPGAKTTPLSQTRPAIQPVSISGPVPSSRLTAPAPVETPIKTMLAFNGLDAATGKPLFAGISMDEVIQMILDERASPDAGKLTSLRRRPAQRGML